MERPSNDELVSDQRKLIKTFRHQLIIIANQFYYYASWAFSSSRCIYTICEYAFILDVYLLVIFYSLGKKNIYIMNFLLYN